MNATSTHKMGNDGESVQPTFSALMALNNLLSELLFN